MKTTAPEFSSDLFDTFASIVSGRSIAYFGANQTLRNTELSASQINALEMKLIKMVALRVGKRSLTKIQCDNILKEIKSIQKSVSVSSKDNLKLLTDELNESKPPINHLVLFFLVCASADSELNEIKKKLRSRLRESKRQKSGKSANMFFDSIFDLQSLSGTGHWHQQNHPNPLPNGLLIFASTYDKFKFLVNQTLSDFKSGKFPEQYIFDELNKGRKIYLTWAIQQLLKITAASKVENPNEAISKLFKALIHSKFSIQPHLKNRQYKNLQDPHLLYMQLQALLICTRLIPN